MRLALKAWHVIPCGLILVLVAGLAAIGFTPRPLTAVNSSAAMVIPQSASWRMPADVVSVYEEAGREDPLTKTDRLLAELLAECSRTK